MLRRHPHRPVTVGAHRSGWSYVLDSISHLYADTGVIFDDFVERTFLYKADWHNDYTYTEPWIGVVHHAPDIPTWYLDNLQLWGMIESPRWLESLPHLKMLVAMAPNLQLWLQLRYPQLPVVLLKHPTGRPAIYWTPERFAQNPDKQLLQVGWFCRNTAAIYQVRAAPDYWLRKSHLRQTVVWVGYTEQLCQTYFRGEEYNYGLTTVIEPQGDVEYDVLLSRNVVFMEVISAAANNTVVECIARNTPIVLNRHPGPLYYLGEDYPLFYDDISHVHELVTPERVLQAHQYLQRMDKTWIRGECFAEDLSRACLLHVTECRQNESHTASHGSRGVVCI